MKNLSILIIDDEESQLQSLKSFLTRRDYEVYTASDGMKGFDIVSSNFIDVVLTDFRMPNWDGFTVLQKVKEFEGRQPPGGQYASSQDIGRRTYNR